MVILGEAQHWLASGFSIGWPIVAFGKTRGPCAQHWLALMGQISIGYLPRDQHWLSRCGLVLRLVFRGCAPRGRYKTFHCATCTSVSTVLTHTAHDSRHDTRAPRFFLSPSRHTRPRCCLASRRPTVESRARDLTPSSVDSTPTISTPTPPRSPQPAPPSLTVVSLQDRVCSVLELGRHLVMVALPPETSRISTGTPAAVRRLGDD